MLIQHFFILPNTHTHTHTHTHSLSLSHHYEVSLREGDIWRLILSCMTRVSLFVADITDVLFHFSHLCETSKDVKTWILVYI